MATLQLTRVSRAEPAEALPNACDFLEREPYPGDPIHQGGLSFTLDVLFASRGDDPTPGREEAMTVHHRSPSPIVCAAMAATIASFLSARPTAAAETTPRVRSSDRSIADLIEQATKHSPILNRLVGTVEASDGIVYVEPGSCPQRLPACLKLWMQTSASTRFMRIVVDRRRLDSDSRLMGAVGHELQHAIEVLSDRSVTDSDKMFFFYRR